MPLTRRDFGRLTLATIPTLTFSFDSLGQLAFAQNSAPLKINSNINGVLFGLQPFCYHDLPMTVQNRPILIQRMVQNGLGIVELHATWVEPLFTAPGVSPQEARDKLRQWRLTVSPDYYRKAKQDFDNAGITIFSYYTNFNDTHTDAEIDAIFEAAKTLGAKSVIGSYGLAVAARLAPFPDRHGMFLGLHNHDNLSDPDSFSNEASFEKGFAISPNFKATLDVRHYTAANGDCLAFLEKHHERVSSVHLGDRRKNNGRSTPFGQGDAAIIEILRMIRDNRWPIVALLEFEHGTLRSGVDEVQVVFDYCKRALT
jgi:sugar phosphate isomerase/epimerase